MNAEQLKKHLGIGQVAIQTGVSVQTVRYYERRGLLKDIARRLSGYRLYTNDNIRTICFIKRSQELGFSLSEIEELLWMQSDNATNRKEVRTLAKAKITDIENRINNLKTIRRALTLLVDSCIGTELTGKCPILEALTNEIKKGKSK